MINIHIVFCRFVASGIFCGLTTKIQEEPYQLLTIQMVDTIVVKLLRYIIIQGLSLAAAVQLVLPTMAAKC